MTTRLAEKCDRWTRFLERIEENITKLVNYKRASNKGPLSDQSLVYALGCRDAVGSACDKFQEVAKLLAAQPVVQKGTDLVIPSTK